MSQMYECGASSLACEPAHQPASGASSHIAQKAGTNAGFEARLVAPPRASSHFPCRAQPQQAAGKLQLRQPPHGITLGTFSRRAIMATPAGAAPAAAEPSNPILDVFFSPGAAMD